MTQEAATYFASTARWYSCRLKNIGGFRYGFSFTHGLIEKMAEPDYYPMNRIKSNISSSSFGLIVIWVILSLHKFLSRGIRIQTRWYHRPEKIQERPPPIR